MKKSWFAKWIEGQELEDHHSGWCWTKNQGVVPTGHHHPLSGRVTFSSLPPGIENKGKFTFQKNCWSIVTIGGVVCKIFCEFSLLLGQKGSFLKLWKWHLVTSFTGVGEFRKNRKDSCKRQHRSQHWPLFCKAAGCHLMADFPLHHWAKAAVRPGEGRSPNWGYLQSQFYVLPPFWLQCISVPISQEQG